MSGARAELDQFRRQLDGEQKVNRVIPGFLFQDGRECTQTLSQYDLERLYDCGWTGLTEQDRLIGRHAETHRRGLEARDQVLSRIRPVEILETVRKIWSKGEIAQTEDGAILTYPYLTTPEEEREPSSWNPGHFGIGDALHNTLIGGGWTRGRKTGKWFVHEVEVQQEVRVKFGNRQNPHPGSLNEEEARKFFVDRGIFKAGLCMVPEAIWSRPDNLLIHVTPPYELLPVKNAGGWYSRPHQKVYFDQSASQKDIMTYLMRALLDQALHEQLPPQVEAMELAKIEELRKRGIFIEGLPKRSLYSYR